MTQRNAPRPSAPRPRDETRETARALKMRALQRINLTSDREQEIRSAMVAERNTRRSKTAPITLPTVSLLAKDSSNGV